MQLILFCGVQASGKSSYYKAHFANTHIAPEPVQYSDARRVHEE